MVTTFFPPYHFGGDGVFVERLSHALAEHGHQVEVVYNVDAFRTLSSKRPSEVREHPLVRRHALASRMGAVELLGMQQTGRPMLHGRRLRELLQDGSFDVIHYHNTSLIGGPEVLRYGRSVKLYTLHEYWLVCPMHILWRYGREPCQKRTCVRCQIVGRRPPQLWRYTKRLDRAIREVDAFIAPSQFSLDLHKELGFEAPLRKIPHFVPEPEDPGSGDWGAGDAAPARDYFLFAGRLERIKGVETLLRVFAQYRKADLVVLGDGTERRRLEAAAAHLPHVRFVGQVSPTELSRYYRSAIACLAPSLCYETFGLSAVESFSCGTAAIVRDRGALAELIEMSGAGFRFGSERELQDRLECLRSDAGLRAELGRRGRNAYLKHWSLESHLRRYQALIEELS
jgi:glycosyltransferase involved in cell wall biosynthesis